MIFFLPCVNQRFNLRFCIIIWLLTEMTSEHENQFSHLEMSASRQQTGLHKHTHTAARFRRQCINHAVLDAQTDGKVDPRRLCACYSSRHSHENRKSGRGIWVWRLFFFFFFVREQNYASKMDKRCMQRSKTRCLVTVLSCEHQSYEHLQTNVIKPEMAQLTVLLVDMRTFSC